MCKSPYLIINPYWKSHTKEYPLLSINGRSHSYIVNVLDGFDSVFFSPKRWGANPDNIESYYAYNVSGECINMYITVPCGHCLECLKSKQTSLQSRMLLEQLRYKDVPPLFLTLTYDDDHLPPDGVSVRDCQLFFKRFRKYYPEYKDFRYILFSEYGSLRQRPHYHAIIYGIDLDTVIDSSPSHYHKYNLKKYVALCDAIRDSWKNGYIYLKTTDSGSFRYVSKYVTKFGDVPYGMNPCFYLASRGDTGGIGTGCLLDDQFMKNVLLSKDCRLEIKVLGKIHRIQLPKYIRDKVYPNLTNLIPENVCKAVSQLVRDLALIHSFDDYFNTDFGDNYNFTFPPHLYHRYALFFPEIDNFDIRPLLSDFEIIASDPTWIYDIVYRVQSNIALLSDYYFDPSEILEKFNRRQTMLTHLQRFMLAYFNQINSIPYNDRIYKYSREIENFHHNFTDGQ